jgi:hypothetical protein
VVEQIGDILRWGVIAATGIVLIVWGFIAIGLAIDISRKRLRGRQIPHRERIVLMWAAWAIIMALTTLDSSGLIGKKDAGTFWLLGLICCWMVKEGVSILAPALLELIKSGKR